MSRPRPTTTREALEEAIRANPEDSAAHAAYADLLQEEGDPRGEFVSMQLALEDGTLTPGERARFKQRERELLAEHERDWLGPLAAVVLDGVGREDWQGDSAEFQNRAVWRRGVLSTLHLGWFPSVVADALGESTDRLSCLRELQITRVPSAPGGRTEAFDPLAGWPVWGQLRVLQLGRFEDEDYGESIDFGSRVDGEEIGWVLEELADIEELYLFARHLNLPFSRPLSRLRVLQYYHGHYHRIGEVAGNESLANLTHLLVHPHESAAEDWPVLDPENLHALLHSPHLPSLAHLRLRLQALGDEACSLLVESGSLKRLKTLDLRHGTITDAGARILADCPDLTNLALLDISRNCLSEEGISRLRATGIRVEAGFQGVLQGEYHEYLYQGDQE